MAAWMCVWFMALVKTTMKSEMESSPGNRSERTGRWRGGTGIAGGFGGGVGARKTAVEWQLRRDGETGIHSRLKICFPATEVWVRVPLPLPDL